MAAAGGLVFYVLQSTPRTQVSTSHSSSTTSTSAMLTLVASSPDYCAAPNYPANGCGLPVSQHSLWLLTVTGKNLSPDDILITQILIGNAIYRNSPVADSTCTHTLAVTSPCLLKANTPFRFHLLLDDEGDQVNPAAKYTSNEVVGITLVTANQEYSVTETLT
jgi:hypothetical protein